jgi:hypothetical protein
MRAYEVGLSVVALGSGIIAGVVSEPLVSGYWLLLLVAWFVITLVFGMLPGSAVGKAVRIGAWGFAFAITADAAVAGFTGISILLGALVGLASIGVGGLMHALRSALAHD